MIGDPLSQPVNDLVTVLYRPSLASVVDYLAYLKDFKVFARFFRFLVLAESPFFGFNSADDIFSPFFLPNFLRRAPGDFMADAIQFFPIDFSHRRFPFRLSPRRMYLMWWRRARVERAVP